MQIDPKTFREIVPSRADIKPWHALAIVRRSYCGPMTVGGMCPKLCVNCTARLLAAHDFRGAQNPQALLTWKLKDAVAKYREEFHKRPIVAPVPMSENPFEAFLHETASA